MANNQTVGQKMRIYHRYLGFFLVGIMAVYSISGIVMIFRTTDVFKVEKQTEQTLDPDLGNEALGKALRIREFKAERVDGDVVYFRNGTYDKRTGEAHYTVNELPLILQKMTHLHKATTNDPLFFLNIFFGVSLFFFVLSSLWMFVPGTRVFKKGLYFVLAGIVMTLILIYIR